MMRVLTTLLVPLMCSFACTPPASSSSSSPSDSTPDGPDGPDDTTPPIDGPTVWGAEADNSVDGVSGLPSFTSEVLFDEDQLPKFYLEISDDSLRSLANDPYEYTEATVTWEGRRFGPIGIRTKGENSWRPFRLKSSFKLDFNRYDNSPDRIGELKGLTFNAMNEDYSMMHERVAYKIYRDAGVPGARAHHALIYVNDEFYGLFIMIDSIDDIFLARWFEDSTGPMWEQHDGDLTNDYVQNNTYFQHESGEDDRTSLQGLADALEGSGPAALAEAGNYLSWDGFYRYWAASSVAMNFDAYPFRFAGDDCHLYFDPTSERLIYIPHGTDETFYSDDDFEGRANGHIAAKCREDPTCRDAWATVVWDTLEIAEDEDIVAYAEEVRDQIEPWVREDPERNYPLDYVWYYQDDMIEKLRNRRSSIEYWIGPRP
jgi:hypothetical protein